MKNFTYFTHESVPKLVSYLSGIWNVYGKEQYALTKNFNHDLINIPTGIISGTAFGRWVRSDLGEIENCKFFVCDSSAWGEVHIDGRQHPRQCAINIPVANCENGLMNWFSNNDTTDPITNHKTSVRTTKHHSDVGYWNAMDSMMLTSAALVRTNSWHNIDNRLNPNPRVVFSIRLKDNPPFEDILDKIKPWTV